MNHLQQLGQIDIYLIDQIMKGRYQNPFEKILDAGCGPGRNLDWFLENGFDIFGIDRNRENIDQLLVKYPKQPKRFILGELDAIPFPDQHFDHIISSAVLHFAASRNHFFKLLDEHLRVLKTDGTLFIRLASDIGLPHKEALNQDGVFLIPDGSSRFLLTRELLGEILKSFPVRMLEPIKTTNVNDIRCMSTLMLTKVL